MTLRQRPGGERGGAGRVIGQLLSPMRRGRPATDRPEPLLPEPLLSVIIPVFNVERYLQAALESVVSQAYENIEIIVVDDGSTDRSPEIIDSMAGSDNRFRVIRQENAGLGAARNAGIEVARGTYLAFFDSDDLLFHDHYANSVRTLESTGSDFSVSPYVLYRGGRDVAPGGWIRGAHDVERLGVSLRAFPKIQSNVVAWSKVYRRSFFESAVSRYPVGTAWEDQVPAALSYARAKSFDVLTSPSVRWRLRDEGSSITQQSRSVDNLRDRFTAVSSALDVLRRHGDEAGYQERLLQVLSTGTFTLRHIHDGDPDYWKTLVEGLRPLWQGVSREALIDRVNIQDRILYELIVRNDFESAVSFIDAGGLNISEWVVVEDRGGELRASLPAWEAMPTGLPRWCWAIRERQLPIQAYVEAMRWNSEGRLEIAGYAYPAGVNELENLNGAVTVEARLFDPANHVAIPLSVQRVSTVRAAELTGHRHLGYSASGFRIECSTSTLVEALKSAKGGTARTVSLELHITVSAAGLVQTTALRKGDLLRGAARTSEVADGRYAIEASFEPGERGVVVEVRKGAPVTVSSVRGDGRVVEIKLAEGEAFDPVRAELVRPVADETRVVDLRKRDADSFEFDVPEWPDHGRDAFRVRLIEASGRKKWTRIDEESVLSAAGRPVFRVIRGAHSQPYFYDARENAFVHAVRVAGDDLEFDIAPPEGADVAELILEGQRHSLRARFSADAGRQWVSVSAAIPGDAEFQSRTVPSGEYSVRLAVGTREEPVPERPVRVQMTPELEAGLPLEDLGSGRLKVTLRSAKGRWPRLTLHGGLTRSERTPRVQRQRQIAYRDSRPEVVPVVYLQCLRGDQVNDTQLATARFISTKYPSIEVVWGIQDSSVRVPIGDRSVLIGSQEYFSVLASAAILCFNHEVELFLESKPGQLVVQTYHGHPFKMMGMGRWEALAMSDIQIERGLAWRNKWDLLMSPTPLATKLYRENFPVRAEIVEIGHPRNDRLVRADEDDRAAARRSLGVSDGVTTVLYAPTWRDYATNDPWKSNMVDFIDPKKFAEMLGPGFQVLLRGHPAHGRAQYVSRDSAGVLDVTYHPDVNDLILAADIGVFDYSSIRFDFGVTGRPMIFLVPDKEEFFAAAPSLVPFEGTAPGPQVSTLEELIDAVIEAGSDRDRWAEAYGLFRETYATHDDGHATERFVSALLDRSPILACVAEAQES